MSKKLLLFTLLFCSLALFLGHANAQDATTITETTVTAPAPAITFPIAELGGCTDKTNCKAYCHDATHFEACMAFAKSHNLLSDERIKKGREELAQRKDKLRDILEESGGPGRCKTKDECRQYCQDVSHIVECADFSKEHGFVSGERALKIKKEFGEGPGGCKSMVECRTYCEEENHKEDCLKFAKEKGLMDDDDVKKAEMLIKEGGPGRCRDKEECQKYCEEHKDECVAFARERGLLTKEREDQIKNPENIHKILETTGGPGGCKSQVECKAYCTDTAHAEECIAFATAHGQMGENKARAILHRFTEGMMSRQENTEELDRVKEDRLQKFEEFQQLEKIFRFKNSIEDEEGFSGPGGCSGAAECIKYCSENKEECFKKVPVSSNANDLAGSLKGEIFKIRPDLVKQLTPSQKEMMQKKMMQLKEEPQKPCPAMPTVSECPEGQTKVRAFSSPECGTYYMCKPTTSALPSREIQTRPDYSVECAKKGGVWNGDYCKVPEPTSAPDNDQSGSLHTKDMLANLFQTLVGIFQLTK